MTIGFGKVIIVPIYEALAGKIGLCQEYDGIDEFSEKFSGGNPTKTYYRYTYIDTKCHCRRLKSYQDGKFYLNSKGYYQLSDNYDPKSNLSLRHFGKGMQKFIKDFSENFWKKSNEDRGKLYEEWLETTKSSDDKIALNCLVNLRIIKDDNENDIVHLNDIGFKNIGSNTPIHECRSKISKHLQDPDTHEMLLPKIEADLCTDLN